MAKQLCYRKLKHPKSICSSMLSCYSEADDVEAITVYVTSFVSFSPFYKGVEEKGKK